MHNEDKKYKKLSEINTDFNYEEVRKVDKKALELSIKEKEQATKINAIVKK